MNSHSEKTTSRGKGVEKGRLAFYIAKNTLTETSQQGRWTVTRGERGDHLRKGYYLKAPKKEAQGEIRTKKARDWVHTRQEKDSFRILGQGRKHCTLGGEGGGTEQEKGKKGFSIRPT